MPINPATIAAGATALNALGGLTGGGGSTSVAIPDDMKQMRQQQIDLLSYLLGFGGTGTPQQVPAGGGQGGQGGQAPQGQRSLGRPSRGWAPGEGPNNTYDWLPSGGGGGGAPTPGGSGLPQFGDPTSRLESFFGGLGVPQSDLQRNAGNAIGEFLKTNPEAKAYDFLNNALTTNPGEQVAGSLLPQFERNLSAAQATGPRFGTANAIAKTRAVDDYNLLSAQARMQGVNQQLQASQILNQLGDSAFNRLTGAYGVGKDQAAQADLATQRRLQLLLQLLGTAQSASFGMPLQQNPNWLSTLGNSGMDLATFLASQQKPVSKAG